MSDSMKNVFKFVSWEVPPLEALQNGMSYVLRKKINDGGKINREEKDWLTLHCRRHGGMIHYAGYVFNFRDIMRKYYFIDNRGHIYRCYACDKTSLRRSIYGKIYNIVEIPKNKSNETD